MKGFPLGGFSASALLLREVSLNVGLDSFLAAMRRAYTRGEIVQAFNPSSIVNRNHVLGACLNALISFREHTNVSRSVGTELLLFAAMTKQIGDAIKIVGARDKNHVLLLASKRGYVHMKRYIAGEKEFEVSRMHEIRAARLLGIRGFEDIDLAVLNRMSAVRLGD